MFDLDRFVKAQGPMIETVLGELRAGRKQTQWMWFIFPQLRGLGRSPAAQHYGIKDLAEGRVYLEHTVLCSRLKECAEAVRTVSGRNLHEFLGSPDDMKLRSSMTLLPLAGADTDVF